MTAEPPRDLDAPEGPRVLSPPSLASPATIVGLTTIAVEAQVAAGRTNAFRPSTGREYRDILRDNLVTPFNVTLVSLLAALLFLGQIGDSFLSGGAVLVNTIVSLVQEVRAKRQMDRLALASRGTVRVRRDGAEREIPPEDVVAGDVLDVRPGDRIRVDGPVVWSDALEIDESLITGESDSIARAEGEALTSGSFVVAGRGLQRAERVGADSFVNRLGQTAAGYKRSLTPIQRSINAIVEISVLLMAIFGPLVFVQGWVGGISVPDMLRNALVIVTTFVPQGLVLATTLALSYGAIRIGLQRTLVQRINAVESMGNVTVLCFDKTGTLTQNVLTLESIVPLDGADEASVRDELAAYVGSLSTENRTAEAIGDAVGRQVGAAKVAETPFTSARKWGAVTFAEGRTLVLGAPEVVAHDDASRRLAAEAAGRGLRVLALAVADRPPVDGGLPQGLRARALVLLGDAARPDVAGTLAELAGRGIALKVISGDSLETVLAVAREVGLTVSGAITGPELDALDDDAFSEVVARVNVFARVAPQTKRRIAAALTARGEYVAMVGDGVNDVPALKEARLGIAMANGSQMARDVSDLVLLDNALTTLPRAFAEGEATTQKVYASTQMLLSKNVYMILAVIFVGFMALPFPGQVRQLSWITTLTTGVPALLVSLGYMHPVPVRDFRREVIGYVIITGLLGGLSLAAVYAIAYFVSGNDADVARTALSFIALAFGVMVLWDVNGVSPFVPRTIGEHPIETLVGVAIGIVGIIVPAVLPGFFRLAPLTLEEWLLLLGATVVAAFVYWRSTFAHPRLLEPISVLVRAGRGGSSGARSV